MSSGAAPGSTTRRPRPSNRNLAGIAVAALLVLWISLNRADVEVSFVVASATVPLWVALTLAGLLGAVAGYLLARRRYRR